MKESDLENEWVKNRGPAGSAPAPEPIPERVIDKGAMDAAQIAGKEKRLIDIQRKMNDYYEHNLQGRQDITTAADHNLLRAMQYEADKLLSEITALKNPPLEKGADRKSLIANMRRDNKK